MSESVRLRAFFLSSVIFYGKIRIENLELLIFFSEYNIFVLGFRSVVFNGDGKINNISYNYNVDEFVENKDSFRNLEN